MKFILGKKIKMTQIWQGDKVVPCTLVQAGPCFITQVKNDKSDSYKAVQISYGERKAKNISKPVKGHLKKALGREDVRYLREFRLKEDNSNIELGKMIDVSTFVSGDIVDVTGTSKGKGFQGVVRRHGFSGSKKTHGNKDQLRASGSVSAKGPAHVFKGTRMGGRMGGDRVTTKNMEVIDIDLENNILYVKGAVPGAVNSLVIIKGEGDLVVKENVNKEESKDVEKIEVEKVELTEDSSEEKKDSEKEKDNNIEIKENKEENLDEKKEEVSEDLNKE